MRHLLTVLSGLALLLAAGLCVLWVTDGHGAVSVGRGYTEYSVICDRNGVSFRVGSYAMPLSALYRTFQQRDHVPLVRCSALAFDYMKTRHTRWGAFGFFIDSREGLSPDGSVGDLERAWVVPPWFAMLMLLAGPAIHLSRIHRERRIRHRRAAGLCAHCGYDLRASSERCPECGAPVSADRPRPRLQ